ncbi:MAG: Purine nucleoside phosphoramidase [Chlamydiales bacterium]|nr:Purine nucleoside phosphoramidase [Chlamydiales bacterium]MCH9635283.1 Purine nucleoside phosphoramidase [Chlamydiales bacterium]MCH9704251.1 histidine triad nucleotide-binding protein [Chlamydiota bacterium]
MEKTLFEKIIAGELPADKVYEDEKIIAIKDKYPKAPVHILIIPKKVIVDIQSLQEEDFPLLGAVVKVAQRLAKEFELGEGYRLVVNNGMQAGQTIFHLHFHLMGGHFLGGMG